MKFEIVCGGRIDQALARPFGVPARLWCRVTGGSPRTFARLMNLVQLVAAVTAAMLLKKSPWTFTQMAWSLVWAVYVVALSARYERSFGGDTPVEVLDEDFPNLLWIAVWMRVTGALSIVLDVWSPFRSRAENSLREIVLWMISDIASVLCWYALTAWAPPSRKVTDRLRDLERTVIDAWRKPVPVTVSDR